MNGTLFCSPHEAQTLHFDFLGLKTRPEGVGSALVGERDGKYAPWGKWCFGKAGGKGYGARGWKQMEEVVEGRLSPTSSKNLFLLATLQML